jgi:hypothetical protein
VSKKHEIGAKYDERSYFVFLPLPGRPSLLSVSAVRFFLAAAEKKIALLIHASFFRMRAGRVISAQTNSSTPVTAIPTIRNGRSMSQISG